MGWEWLLHCGERNSDRIIVRMSWLSETEIRVRMFVYMIRTWCRKSFPVIFLKNYQRKSVWKCSGEVSHDVRDSNLNFDYFKNCNRYNNGLNMFYNVENINYRTPLACDWLEFFGGPICFILTHFQNFFCFITVLSHFTGALRLILGGLSPPQASTY